MLTAELEEEEAGADKSCITNVTRAEGRPKPNGSATLSALVHVCTCRAEDVAMSSAALSVVHACCVGFGVWGWDLVVE